MCNKLLIMNFVFNTIFQLNLGEFKSEFTTGNPPHWLAIKVRFCVCLCVGGRGGGSTLSPTKSVGWGS